MNARNGLGLLAVVIAGCAVRAQQGERSSSSAAGVVSCAAGATVEGVDVSYFQGSIDWASVRASGSVFAFARVSDGDDFLDPQFDANWSGMKAAGIVRGVYQFFRPEQDAASQASLLLSHASFEPGDLPPVLDVEVADGVGYSAIADGIATWVSIVQSATGRAPIVYTAASFWDGVGGGSDGTDLWVASWGVSCPSLPSSWSSWRFWQYADDGTVAGISGTVDLDEFDGTLADLQAYAAGDTNGAGAGGTGLPSLGGNVTSDPAVASNADGRLEVFGVGADGALWTTFQTTPNGSWSDWYSLAGAVTGTPAVTQNQDGRLEAFAIGADRAVWHTWQTAPSGSFGGWASLEGSVQGDPVVAPEADGRLDVFATGADGAIWHVWQTAPSSGWSDWASLAAPPAGGLTDPRVVLQADGQIAAFARGSSDGAVYESKESSGGWTPWFSLDGAIEGALTVGLDEDTRVEVFARGADGALWHDWETSPGGAWSGWFSLAGLVSAPSVARNGDGRLEVFVKGGGQSLWHIAQNTPNGGWDGWQDLQGTSAGAPAWGQNEDGRLEVFVRGPDGSIGHVWQTSPGTW